jgi:glycosyltransferase involved in cell wall biosynthesis
LLPPGTLCLFFSHAKFQPYLLIQVITQIINPLYLNANLEMRKFLVITQAYPPDPTAVGQYLADVACELARHGHSVTVITSDRGYDDTSIKYRRYERFDNLRVLRLPLTSFGKTSIGVRAIGGVSLAVQSTIIGLLTKRFSDVLLSTSPPFISVVGVILRKLRGIPFDLWLMDLNPDQAIEFGKISKTSLLATFFELLNRSALVNARKITFLDDEMRCRFIAKGEPQCSLVTMPLWPLNEAGISQIDDTTFKQELNLHDRRIIMYSGNHSLVHPLDAIFDVAKRPEFIKSLGFAFVGGGVGKVPIDNWVERFNPENIRSLPYQPLKRLNSVLSAADVHLVVVGKRTVGLVHPSKIYGALIVGKPILVVAPKNSPAARLVVQNELGWHVENDDREALLEVFKKIAVATSEEFRQIGSRVLSLASTSYSREVLLKEFTRSYFEQ